MSTREDRIEQIDSFMQNEFPANLSARGIKTALWPSMIALTAGQDYHRPFGYSSVQYFPYDDKWAFFYCAAVMADMTADLDDLAFAEWMRYVRAHVNAHTQLDTQDESLVDEHVFVVLPEARELLGRVTEQFLVF